MPTLDKANELLSEIDTQIKDAEKSLKELKAQRQAVTKLLATLGGSIRRTRKPKRKVKAKRAKRGRPRLKKKSAKKTTRKKASRTRTNWDSVISRFKGTFSIEDLAKASKKAKPTVNQAIQNLKKAGKIKSSGKRGEYQRVGTTSKTSKSKVVKKKAVKRITPKKATAQEQSAPSTAQ